MNCKECGEEFVQNHFNQSLCSDECKRLSRKRVVSKYEHSDKGKASEFRWRNNPKKREIDSAYYTSEKGRACAVRRIARLIKNNEYYLFRKRLSQTASYRKLRASLIGEFGKCQCCGCNSNLTIDHIKPLSMGGIHNRENIQVLCRSCNSRKKQKTERYELQEV